jgi:outer membrane protein OmpA-like peptidoglycan-associated protein
MLQATEAVQTAESDPAVPRYASIELAKSHNFLESAHKAAQDHKPVVSDHFAYLAMQAALTATARAKVKSDEEILAKGENERTKIQLQAREHKVGQARTAVAAERARADDSVAEAQRLRERSDQLSQELEQLKAKQTARGLVLTLGDVLFDTGKAVLKPGASRTLERLAAFLQAHPDRKLQVEGFTDNVGADDYNQQLSNRRAESVKTALVGLGIAAERITTKGYGETYPVASNRDAAGRQLNRRVEVIIGNDNEAVPERSGPSE